MWSATTKQPEVRMASASVIVLVQRSIGVKFQVKNQSVKINNRQSGWLYNIMCKCKNQYQCLVKSEYSEHYDGTAGSQDGERIKKTVEITKFQMGWGSTKTQCQCNVSQGALTRMQDCASSKEVLSACAPIITAAVKSTCGVRRMFVSAFILIVLLAAIYWISIPHQRADPLRRPMRIHPQSSRSIAPE